jgi:BON domain-containing protein
MFQRWQWMVMAALMITLPLAARNASGQETGHTPVVKAAKKPAKPGAKVPKPGPKAAKSSSRSRRQPGPGAMMSHRPPTPPPSHSHFDIPQANSLAQTPDVVLNSRVRASLMSALTAANEQDIEPQTVNGVVTLTGSVKSKALRARAEQVARKVHGVRAVKNALKVK